MITFLRDAPPPVFRKTFLGYIVTKGLFSLQKDLCTFERDEKMFTILFSKVNVLSQKKKKNERRKISSTGRIKPFKNICICLDTN